MFIRTKKKSLFALLLFLSGNYLYSQTWDWVQTIRPGGNEYCWDVATDMQGNILATGRVKAISTFGSGTYTVTTNPIGVETDVFTAKYRPNGNLIWVKRDGGYQPDWGRAITTDNQGNVFVTGDYCDSAYFGTFKIKALGTNLNRNIFLAKYDSSGTCLWVKSAGNVANYSKGYGITTDTIGNSYLTGYIAGASNFDGKAFGTNGYSLPFIAKFSPQGTCIWAKQIDVQGSGEGNDVKVDNSGNLLLTGTYKGTLYWGATPFPGNSPSWGDIFLMKMNSTTGNIIWVKTAIGAYQDQANGLGTDSKGNIYIVGTFANDLTFNSTTINSLGWSTNATSANAKSDAFIAKYNTDGAFKWVKTIGNINDIALDDIEITTNDKIHVAGYVKGPDVNIAGIAINTDTTNVSCITAFDTTGNVLWYKLDYKKNTGITPRGLCADKYGNCYIGGEFIGDPNVDFDSITVQSIAGIDGYVAKLMPPLQPLISANTSVCPNQNINFSAIQDGYPLSYQWDFTGGSPASSTLMNPVVNYSIAGTYTVTLTIGNGHTTNVTTLSIDVTPSACTTSLNDYASNINILIAPNPSSSIATIHINGLDFNAQTTSFQLYNFLGQQFGAPTLITDNTITLNVENIPSGGYFINIIQNNSIVKTEKLIVINGH